MPPRRKVPYREVEVTQELTAKPPSWKKIERSIGCTLSNDVRTQLQGATQGFVWFARSEKEAVPLSDVVARLAKVKSAAGHLQSALCEGFASSGGIAGSYAKKIFKAHWRGTWQTDPITACRLYEKTSKAGNFSDRHEWGRRPRARRANTGVFARMRGGVVLQNL